MHATFSDSSPSGSAPVSWHGECRRRKQPAQASPSRIIGQPHTGPRCSIHRNEAYTTNYNSAFPAPASRQVATQPSRFVHPHSWSQPTKTSTFPHQQAEKSPLPQRVVSYNPNPRAPGRTDRREANDPLGEPTTDKQKRRGANLTVDPSAYPINTVHVRPNSSSEDSRRRGHYGRHRLSLYASTVGSQPCRNDNTT